MDPIIVVGAGIAGVACARTVADAGLPVVVIDRGRRLGGRMASRRLEDRPVDLGASYFTVSDDRFAAVVERWESAALARRWTDSFAVIEDGRVAAVKSGPLRWGTAGGMRTLVEDLAGGLEVRTGEVELVGPSSDGAPLVDGEAGSAVVLAMPDAQARRLLAPGLVGEAAALQHDFEPVLALAACFGERSWAGVQSDLSEEPFDGAFVNGDEHLAWIADDGRRRGDGAAVLVAHSTTTYAAAHLADPQAALPPMAAALRRVLGIEAEPTTTYLQRWSLAKPATTRDAAFLLGDSMIGVCGDAWSPTSKVEGAFLSGVALGAELVARLG